MITRWLWTLPWLALAGTVVCAGQVIWWSAIGAWPFHDTVDGWLAGKRLLAGESVYVVDTQGAFLVFLQAPPWAVLWAAVSWLPVELVALALLVAQVVAFRYVAGSWLVAGLVAWTPWVPRELVTGNIDFLIAAGILAGIRGSGWPIALFAASKFSPAIVLLGANRRQWFEAIAAGSALIAITLPWPHLWTEWLTAVTNPPEGGWSWLPLYLRAPIAIALLVVRKPWALAASAGLLVPVFHFHSVVLLFPAARLAWDDYAARKSDAGEGVTGGEARRM